LTFTGPVCGLDHEPAPLAERQGQRFAGDQRLAQSIEHGVGEE
jgi:hypothetical protein